MQPYTLFVNKATITGDTHGRLTWGPAQAGVAEGVLDAVADGLVPDAGDLVLIAAVWVDPAADDASAIRANNRAATRDAIARGAAGYPTVDDALAARDDVWNPFC